MRPTTIPTRGCLLNLALQGSKGKKRKLRSAAFAAVDDVYVLAWPSEPKPYKKTKEEHLTAQLQRANEQNAQLKRQLELEGNLQRMNEENAQLKRQLYEARHKERMKRT